MNEVNKNSLLKPWLFGLAGAILTLFIGWEFNSPLAPWLAFPLLIVSFRGTGKWYATLPVVLVLSIVRFFVIHGGWDGMAAVLELTFALATIVPLVAALYLDRAFAGRLSPLLGTLLFPSVYIALDWVLIYTNLGMTFSLSYTQATFLALSQSAALFGSWFTGFLVAWTAPVLALAYAKRRELAATWKPLVFYASILALVLGYGSFRLSVNRPASPTVRVASISVAHAEDYWNITDKGTPREEAAARTSSMAAEQDQLFARSKAAVDYGARIIFWSEGNCPLYEDDYPAYLEKAGAFARQHQVWFMPAMVVLHYGQTWNDNLAVLFKPDGTRAWRYEKTISWYPSQSDGKVPLVDTPYGRLASVICFDMDYPNLIRQARNADIMLVPAFDTLKIDDYHTRVAFLRGIENGFSVVRQASKGTSIAADWRGSTIAYQRYATTEERTMISDVPTKGVWTLYGATGEIFLWLVWAGLAALIVLVVLASRRARSEVQGPR